MGGYYMTDPTPDPPAGLPLPALVARVREQGERLGEAQGDAAASRWAAVPTSDDPDVWHVYAVHEGEPPDDFAGHLLGTFHDSHAEANARLCAAARNSALPADALALCGHVERLEAACREVADWFGEITRDGRSESIEARLYRKLRAALAGEVKQAVATVNALKSELRDTEALAREVGDARDALAAEVARLKEFEEIVRPSILWNTPYPREAELLDECRKQEERAEMAEADNARLRAAAEAATRERPVARGYVLEVGILFKVSMEHASMIVRIDGENYMAAAMLAGAPVTIAVDPAALDAAPREGEG
jgi:hypothetical protein